jgi:uncharacterized membrane protein SpoIIM required for sporulation
VTTPLQFEQQYEAEWAELEAAVERIRAGRTRLRAPDVDGVRVAALYRRACEHLALARARSYPAFLLDRLEELTSNAHQVIYQRRELGVEALRRLVTRDFPRAVRAHAKYVWTATAVFLVPAVVLGTLVYRQPELILSVVNAETATSFDEMYSPTADHIGRTRSAGSDWMMFGFYVRNNIGVAFQCFAAGLFAGVGSLFFLAVNGVLGGAIAGYLIARGMASTFWSFVVTHAAFELTAIVLAGAAGMRIGHALLAPGRRRRLQALVDAAREMSVIVYGVIAMLVIAAAVEAFWSSAGWLPAPIKYGVAAVCWTAVLGYLALQGRRAG